MRGTGALGAPALKLAGDGAVSVAGLASSARGAAALEGLRLEVRTHALASGASAGGAWLPVVELRWASNQKMPDLRDSRRAIFPSANGCQMSLPIPAPSGWCERHESESTTTNGGGSGGGGSSSSSDSDRGNSIVSAGGVGIDGRA